MGHHRYFATSFLHFPLFFIALWVLPNKRAVENREKWRKLVAKYLWCPSSSSSSNTFFTLGNETESAGIELAIFFHREPSFLSETLQHALIHPCTRPIAIV